MKNYFEKIQEVLTKQNILEAVASFFKLLKTKIVALYRRLKSWPIGWLINLGLAILILILLLIMFISFRRDERGVTVSKEAVVFRLNS